MKPFSVLLFLASIGAVPVQGALVFFNFREGALGIEGTSGSMTVDGVTLTTTGVSPSGEVNTTGGAGLGINNKDSTSDKSARFDQIIGEEWWTFEFSEEIFSLTLDFNSLTGSDEFQLESFEGDFAVQTINDGTTNAGKEYRVEANIVAGNEMTLKFVTAAPAESSLNSIEVDLVPEPGGVSLALLGVLLALRRRR